jgi:hypothetical protein
VCTLSLVTAMEEWVHQLVPHPRSLFLLQSIDAACCAGSRSCIPLPKPSDRMHLDILPLRQVLTQLQRQSVSRRFAKTSLLRRVECPFWSIVHDFLSAIGAGSAALPRRKDETMRRYAYIYTCLDLWYYRRHRRRLTASSSGCDQLKPWAMQKLCRD